MSVPWACCSAPRAVSTMTRSASPSSRASARTSSAATPVTRSTRSGHQAAATSRRPRRSRWSGASTYACVDAASGDHHVQQPRARARSVPGTGCSAHVGAVGGRRTPRVDHDDLAAARAQRVEVPGRRRHGLGEVGPDEHEHVGLLDVARAGTAGRGRRRTRACPPTRPTTCTTGRCSRSALVPQRDPGELAERVGLLVGQPAAAEHRHRVVAVLGLQVARAGRRPGRAPRPTRRPGTTRRAVADQRAW